MPSVVGMYLQYPLPSRMIDMRATGPESQRRRAAAVRQSAVAQPFHLLHLHQDRNRSASYIEIAATRSHALSAGNRSARTEDPISRAAPPSGCEPKAPPSVPEQGSRRRCSCANRRWNVSRASSPRLIPFESAPEACGRSADRAARPSLAATTRRVFDTSHRQSADRGTPRRALRLPRRGWSAFRRRSQSWRPHPSRRHQ